MDAQAKLDQITALIEGARAMPMSASCVVNRGEVLEALDELRAMLPQELAHARAIIDDREGVVDEGRLEADRIIEAAHAERTRMLSKDEVAAAAGREADRLLTEAQDEVERMRREVDEYVDAKLANFEVVLQKTAAAVERGRAKLRGRSDMDAIGDVSDFAETPLPG